MEHPHPRFGLTLKELTAERLAGIIRLYDQSTDANRAPSWRAESRHAELLEALHERGQCEWRFGYPGNAHGKLKIEPVPLCKAVRVWLDTNDDVNRRWPEGSLRRMSIFRDLLEQYLETEGVSMPLRQPGIRA